MVYSCSVNVNFIFQCAKTFLKLMGQIAKDQTIQYILTMVDDMLQVNSLVVRNTDIVCYLIFQVSYIFVWFPHTFNFHSQEDKSRVEVFREYARRNKESVWGPFLNMLNRPDGFIVNQVSQLTFRELALIYVEGNFVGFFSYFFFGFCNLRKWSHRHAI